MAGKTTRGDVHIIMKQIEHFPGETRYQMVAEIPNKENMVGIIVRDMFGVVKLDKESDVHPAVAAMMVRYVKNHLAQVHLD